MSFNFESKFVSLGNCLDLEQNNALSLCCLIFELTLESACCTFRFVRRSLPSVRNRLFWSSGSFAWSSNYCWLSDNAVRKWSMTLMYIERLFHIVWSLRASQGMLVRHLHDLYLNLHFISWHSDRMMWHGIMSVMFVWSSFTCLQSLQTLDVQNTETDLHCSWEPTCASLDRSIQQRSTKLTIKGIIW